MREIKKWLIWVIVSGTAFYIAFNATDNMVAFLSGYLLSAFIITQDKLIKGQ